MNPGKLNHRIKFYSLQSVGNIYGGVTANRIELITTWGSLEPIKQYNQTAIEAGASVLNGDKMLVIRYRKSFTPIKNMEFEDLNTAGDIYTVRAILPYWPGTMATFQTKQDKVYKDTNFVFILGTKRQ